LSIAYIAYVTGVEKECAHLSRVALCDSISQMMLYRHVKKAGQLMHAKKEGCEKG